MSYDIDVLVIGAGAGGLVAAIAAHDGGANVAIVEKQQRAGGNSALSTGSMPGAGSRFQKAAGIEDSPERFIADIQHLAPDNEDTALLRRLAETCAATVEWLVDRAGVNLILITDYKHLGHSVPRLHAPPSRRGQDLVDDLLRAVATRGIPLAVGNAVVELLVQDGAVVGALCDSGEGAEPIRARHTILAVNGFAANRTLIARFCPEIAGADYFGALGSTGEAIIWGEALGAAFGNMGAYQGYAAVSDPHGGIVSWTTVEKGGIILNPSGRRFGDEGLGYSGFTPVVRKQDGSCIVVFDRRMRDIAARESEFVEIEEHGGIRRFDSIDALAQAFKLDGAALAEDIHAYNRAASGDAPDPHGRTQFGIAPLQGPFHACRAKPGIFHTQGGLMIDADARVLRMDGTTVPGLFAVGGCTAGISGRAGPRGYASGNGLLSAMGLGRMAGESAGRGLA